MAIDPATQRMCEETGHSCEMCSADVRNLRAVAHNLAWRLREAMAGGHEHWPKVRVMLEDLEKAVESLKPESEKHHKALNDWRRP